MNACPWLARSLAFVVLAALGTAPCAAHEFWAEPSTYRPDLGSELVVRLRVGDPPQHEEFPASNRHRARFELLGARALPIVPGPDKTPPAGRVQVDAPGLHWIVYRSHDSQTTLAPDAFRRYLGEEGLERWTPHWTSWDPAQTTPVTEAFSRCVKALVHVGDAPGARHPCAPGFRRRAGLTLELVPLLNPLSVRPGGWLPFQLLLHGQPAPRRLVKAFRPDAAVPPQRAWTDACGVVRFRLPEAGAWLFSSVHLEPAPPGEAVRYRSVWTSLTFELRAARATCRPGAR